MTTWLPVPVIDPGEDFTTLRLLFGIRSFTYGCYLRLVVMTDLAAEPRSHLGTTDPSFRATFPSRTVDGIPLAVCPCSP
jgi:hypothetical protein